jgi:hypothetical protein
MLSAAIKVEVCVTWFVELNLKSAIRRSTTYRDVVHCRPKNLKKSIVKKQGMTVSPHHHFFLGGQYQSNGCRHPQPWTVCHPDRAQLAEGLRLLALFTRYARGQT